MVKYIYHVNHLSLDAQMPQILLFSFINQSIIMKKYFKHEGDANDISVWTSVMHHHHLGLAACMVYG